MTHPVLNPLQHSRPPPEAWAVLEAKAAASASALIASEAEASQRVLDAREARRQRNGARNAKRKERRRMPSPGYACAATPPLSPLMAASASQSSGCGVIADAAHASEHSVGGLEVDMIIMSSTAAVYPADSEAYRARPASLPPPHCSRSTEPKLEKSTAVAQQVAGSSTDGVEEVSVGSSNDSETTGNKLTAADLLPNGLDICSPFLNMGVSGPAPAHLDSLETPNSVLSGFAAMVDARSAAAPGMSSTADSTKREAVASAVAAASAAAEAATRAAYMAAQAAAAAAVATAVARDSSSGDELKESSEQSSGERTAMEFQVPPNLVCSITQQLMVDPVITADGTTYEREAIESWIAKKQGLGHAVVSPLTNEALSSSNLVPNLIVRTMVLEFAEAHAVHSQECQEYLSRIRN